MAALTTTANLRAWLGLTTVSPEVEAQLNRVVEAVSAAVRSYLNRDVLATERTETYDGTGSDLLVLRQAPVLSVARVQLNGQDVPPSSFRITQTALVRTAGTWRHGWGNLVITYTAGYATVPFDLEQAVLELAALRWKERDRIGLVSKGFGQETTTFLRDMPSHVRDTLNNYRRVVPC